MSAMTGKTSWYCVNTECGAVLGNVVAGELEGEDIIKFSTRGPNLEVICPACGTKKVWYTADPLVRASYQLIDAVATMMVNRMFRASKVSNMDKISVADSKKE